MSSVLDVLDANFADASPKAGTAQTATSRPATSGSGDPEIKAMLAEAPLLDLIRSDTGEQGRESGGIVYFERCPVCGHADCFRFYPSSNSWSCFSKSNPSGYEGGSYIEYQVAAHGMDVKEAVRSLREATGHPIGGGSKGDEWQELEFNNGVVGGPIDAPKVADDAPKLLLPAWEAVRAVNPPKRSPVLVEGVLRRGHVGLISGKAKSTKSWCSIMLAIAVATGRDWLGFPCERGRVLYVDPEIDRPSLDQRFRKVADAMGVSASEVEAGVTKWCLRGAVTSKGEPPFIDALAHDIVARCSRGDFDLVIIDSCSCFLKGDENSSVEVHRFFAQVHRIIAATGAAVWLVHHFGKGDAGDRSSIDRARGSSVWGDSPDAPLSLTEIYPKAGEPSDYLCAGERALVLEDSGLREFPSIEPVHLIWSYPVDRVDVDGITSDWVPKTSQGRSKGGNKTAEANRSKSEARRDQCVIALLAHMYAEGIGTDGLPAIDAASVCSDALGETVKPATLKKYLEDSDALDVWQRSPRRWLVVPRRIPRGGEQPSML